VEKNDRQVGKCERIENVLKFLTGLEMVVGDG